MDLNGTELNLGKANLGVSLASGNFIFFFNFLPNLPLSTILGPSQVTNAEKRLVGA